jgi:hypothetical protein
MISRLSTVAPDLAGRLEKQSPERLKIVAANAANLAVTRTQLADPRLDVALASLRDGGTDNTAERYGVQQLTNELDEIAWNAQEMAETGAASREEYSAAFRRARAAASVDFALDSDALSAALEAVYEAQAAVADLEAMRVVVNAVLE